jgi:hypothetical protein
VLLDEVFLAGAFLAVDLRAVVFFAGVAFFAVEDVDFLAGADFFAGLAFLAAFPFLGATCPPCAPTRGFLVAFGFSVVAVSSIAAFM